MTQSFKPTTVAIGDLVAHPANVRTNSPETYASENIAHLKASIAVLGLLQPLLVQKMDGKFGVLAGGRRHAALLELVADKSAKGERGIGVFSRDDPRRRAVDAIRAQMDAVADDQDQGGVADRTVPVRQEGGAAARMRDLGRDAGRGEAEKCHRITCM